MYSNLKRGVVKTSPPTTRSKRTQNDDASPDFVTLPTRKYSKRGEYTRTLSSSSVDESISTQPSGNRYHLRRASSSARSSSSSTPQSLVKGLSCLHLNSQDDFEVEGRALLDFQDKGDKLLRNYPGALTLLLQNPICFV